MENDEFRDKSQEIRQLASMSPEQMVDHFASVHPTITEVAPNIAPHVHAAAMNAVQFLNSKLPSQGAGLAFDQDLPTANAEKNQWLDLHGLLNDPASIIDKVKDGSINNHHIEAMQAVYPDLHKEISLKMQEAMGSMKAKNQSLPYSAKVSISRMTGQPLDSTMTPQAAQSIIASSAQQQSQQQSQAGKQKKASGVELKQINKVDSLYATDMQSRLMSKRA